VAERRSTGSPGGRPHSSDRPLRILHVVEAFGGGVLEVVKTLAENLAADGSSVAVAYGRRPESPTDPRASFSSSIELFPLPWERRGIAEQLAAAREMRRVAAAWRHDVVHLHSSFAGLIGSLALGRSAPTIYTPHGYSFTMRAQSAIHHQVFKTAERITARRVNVVGAVSLAEAADARQVAPAEKIVVVRNGIPELDEPLASPPPRPAGDRPRVITVGRLVEQRRPEAAARILASISDIADVSWVGGSGRGDIPESTVSDLGVPVTGWLERSQVLETLRAATVSLHWSGWDGQPLSILEAMANDVVVIASDIEATREILGGRQVCSTEAEASALIREVLRDPGLREDMIASQRERSPQFGARRMGQEWRTVYEQLAEGAPLPLQTSAASAPREPQTMIEPSPDPQPEIR
jgi:glycosyltransferase involved in cell wall biosynthesis